MKVAVVASGRLEAIDVAHLDDADLVVAADGGAESLDALGRRPDLLVGDFDSVSPALAERLEAAGTCVERHPADKERSDTELALEAALARGATEVVLLGAIGGDRLDHELANLLLLADPGMAGRDVRIARGSSTARVLRGGERLALAGSAGDLVSLLPIGGDASGVTTDGLRWPLEAATLGLGRSRGLSNEIAAAPASVSLEHGTLLVVETALRGAAS
jgi:thiamine pyrophosphokinase